jgi:uncharacterized protein YerC
MISLYQAFQRINTEADFNAFVADLCTPTEIRELNSRWKIAQLLWNTAKERSAGLNQKNIPSKKGPPRSKIGFSQDDIVKMANVGKSTVTRVSKCLFENTDGGYRKVLSSSKNRNS